MPRSPWSTHQAIGQPVGHLCQGGGHYTHRSYGTACNRAPNPAPSLCIKHSSSGCVRLLRGEANTILDALQSFILLGLQSYWLPGHGLAVLLKVRIAEGNGHMPYQAHRAFFSQYVCRTSQAIGRYLLQDVDRSRFAQERFLLCQQLASSMDFAVLTAAHLLSIHSPGLRFLPSLTYAVALEDVIFIRRCDISAQKALSS